MRSQAVPDQDQIRPLPLVSAQNFIEEFRNFSSQHPDTSARNLVAVVAGYSTVVHDDQIHVEVAQINFLHGLIDSRVVAVPEAVNDNPGRLGWIKVFYSVSVVDLSELLRFLVFRLEVERNNARLDDCVVKLQSFFQESVGESASDV